MDDVLSYAEVSGPGLSAIGFGLYIIAHPGRKDGGCECFSDEYARVWEC